MTGACLALVTMPLPAAELYKWISEDGSTHYSEHLPSGEVAAFEVLQIVPPIPVPEPRAFSYRSVLDLAASLQADRLARERLRLEKEKLRQQARLAREAQARYDEVYSPTSYIVPYYGYHHRTYPRPSYQRKYPGHSPPYVPKRVYLDR